MAKRGGRAIVKLSSGGATRAHRGMVAYFASKGGVEAYPASSPPTTRSRRTQVDTLLPSQYPSVEDVRDDV
jgi:3-oxoacyl-[acyl-carrier protein] reductase